jgi:hypothetical protein
VNTTYQSPRQKALANNEITYFTGKPCNKGHLSVRFTLTSNCKECQQSYAKEHQTRLHLKKRFGLTEREYDLILEKQNGVCAICKDVETVIDGQSKKVKPLSVDHDHKTGKIRGLLCTKCNVGLGAFNDEVCVLLNAAEYLKKHE